MRITLALVAATIVCAETAHAAEGDAGKHALSAAALATELKSSLTVGCSTAAGARITSEEDMIALIQEWAAGEDATLVESALASLAADGSLCESAKVALVMANQAVQATLQTDTSARKPGSTLPVFAGQPGPPPLIRLLGYGIPGGTGGPGYQTTQ